MKKFFLLSLLVSMFAVSCGSDKNAAEPVYYSGEDVSALASITRDKETKIASVTVTASGEWSLYSGSSDKSIDLSASVANSAAAGTYTLDAVGPSWRCFQFVTEKGRAVMSEKLLPMSGGYNFRDLGGIKTSSGKFVKWGKLFRADAMDKLTAADLAYLSSIPVAYVVDFRSEGEGAADQPLSSAEETYNLSIEAGNIPFDEKIFQQTPATALALMNDIYIQFVTDEATIAQYKEFFRLLQDGKTPMIFHCTSGKDRTGFSTALVLYALGVDEDTIYEDYLLSNTLLAAKNAGTIQYVLMQIDGNASIPDAYKDAAKANMTAVLNCLLGVDRAYLKTSFDRIKADHGSVNNYLTTVLGVDIAQFRSMYLY